MKKYLLTGGLSTVLLLGACGTSNEESADAEGSNQSEEIEELEAENEELNLQVEELESKLSEQESEEASGDGNEIATEETDAGSRTEPLDVGDTGTISILTYADDEDVSEINGVAEITVDNVVRGQEAEEILTNEYSEPDEAPEGLEWVVFDVNIALTELSDDNEAISFSEDFEIITEDGSPVEKEYTTFDEEFGVQDVYSGGTAEGKIALHAPKDEPFIIHYDDVLEGQAYFQVN